MIGKEPFQGEAIGNFQCSVLTDLPELDDEPPRVIRMALMLYAPVYVHQEIYDVWDQHHYAGEDITLHDEPGPDRGSDRQRPDVPLQDLRGIFVEPEEDDEGPGYGRDRVHVLQVVVHCGFEKEKGQDCLYSIAIAKLS